MADDPNKDKEEIQSILSDLDSILSGMGGAPASALPAVPAPETAKAVTPTPAVPPRIRVRARPPAASSSTAARRANATSRPTNRALV